MPLRPALLAALALPALAAAAPDPTATIDTGRLRGSEAAGVVAFKGIPFAAPPVGALRWRAPQPAARWTGTRDATRYGADCMQKPFPSDAAPLGTTPAEDCLFANVWRPAGAAKRLPVLVWIYGGGFVNGGASPPTYAGDALARAGIVVVSFNYRLGRFGTFAYPGIDPAGEVVGNYGYQDQLAALRWVRRNVAAFGGDPARVTIMGESAGGMSVHALITSPMAAGLFRGAVILSGGPVPGGEPTAADARTAATMFARAKGIADGPAAPAALRALPADAVVDGLNLATTGVPLPHSWTAPIADGRLAVPTLPAYRAGRFAHVPVMVGATSDDIGGADGFMATGARTIADLLAEQGVPVWAYRFSYVAASVRTPATRGAGHASDIPFFLDTAAIKYGDATAATDRAAARLASGYLVDFVKAGDPNGGGRPRWARHAGAGGAAIDLDANGGATPLAAR